MQFQTRWAQLFADLDAQFIAAEATELGLEVADRTRGELAGIELSRRLRARIGQRVDLHVCGAGRVAGSLLRMGADWALVATERGEPVEVLVMLDAVVAAVDLPLRSVADGGLDVLASRVGRGPALRALARDRALVRVVLRDGTIVRGTPDRVGADFLDLALHDRDDAPRPDLVTSRWTIAWAPIAVVGRET